MDPTILKMIQDLQAQIDALKSHSTIPLDIGEAMKARIFGQSAILLGQTNPSAPATMTVTDTNGANPPVNYTVCAPFSKQLIIQLGDVTYIVPAN